MTSQEKQDSGIRRSTALLAIGAALGLAMAAWGLLQDAAGARLPEGAVARINGTVIRTLDFERLVAVVLRDMRTPDGEKARQRVLDRLIEEELLIQRALDLGMVHLDRKVRADLTASVIESVVSDVRDVEPSAAELESYFAENKDYFTRPPRTRVRQIFFRTTAANPEAGAVQTRAEKARKRLAAGDDYAEVKAALGDYEISPIPDAMLPGPKLREYTGPALMGRIDALAVGQWSEPVRSGTGVHLVQLVDREPARTPPLAEIRKQVTIDWIRRQGDRALRRYLEELRVRAVVEIAEGYP